MYELSEDNAVADNEVCPCSSCGQPFALSELHRYVSVCLAMRSDGSGCQTIQHDHGLQCDGCIQQTKEERLQEDRSSLLLRREQEKKEAEERKAIYLRILSQNQQATENEN